MQLDFASKMSLMLLQSGEFNKARKEADSMETFIATLLISAWSLSLVKSGDDRCNAPVCRPNKLSIFRWLDSMFSIVGPLSLL